MNDIKRITDEWILLSRDTWKYHEVSWRYITDFFNSRVCGFMHCTPVNKDWEQRALFLWAYDERVPDRWTSCTPGSLCYGVQFQIMIGLNFSRGVNETFMSETKTIEIEIFHFLRENLCPKNLPGQYQGNRGKSSWLHITSIWTISLNYNIIEWTECRLVWANMVHCDNDTRKNHMSTSTDRR